MTLEEELALSFYREVADINQAHGITLVQHLENQKFFVKKVLTVYNAELFQHLKTHPVRNTPHIYELAEEGNTLILIEEYIPGQTLQELLDAHGPLPKSQVIDYMLQLCQILTDLHSRQPAIVHRDIKPSNIMLSPDGVVKLLDMNAAKWHNSLQTRDTVLIGTREFAAPEQYGFGPSTIQTDIYAVGVLINVLSTGHFPKEETVSGPLSSIVAKCTEFSPKHRYHNVTELSSALSALQPGAAPAFPSARGWQRYLLPGFRTKNPLKMISAAIGYICLLRFGLTLELEHTLPLELLIDRVSITALLLAAALFSANYLNVQQRVPLTRSGNPFLRTAGIVLTDILIIAAGALVITFLEVFLIL